MKVRQLRNFHLVTSTPVLRHLLECAEALEHPLCEQYFQARLGAYDRSYRRASVSAERKLSLARSNLLGFLSSLGVIEQQIVVPTSLLAASDGSLERWLFDQEFSTGHLKLRAVSQIDLLRTYLGAVMMAQHDDWISREGHYAIMKIRDELAEI